MENPINKILGSYTGEYKISNSELSRLFSYAKGETDANSRTFDTPTDYIIALDLYLKQVTNEKVKKQTINKDGILEEAYLDKPILLVSFFSFIGHTAKRWEKAKTKSEAHAAVLEDIEQFFAADGTEKGLLGVYKENVALKVLPIVLKENEEKANKIDLNIVVNGQSIELA